MKTCDLIRKHGWDPFIVHTVELVPYDREEILAQVKQVVSLGVDWLVFMSSTGVGFFFDAITRSKPSSSVLGTFRTVAVGPGTRDALNQQGIADVAIPGSYSSEGVMGLLSKFPLENRRVILIRSSAASRELAQGLESKGATVMTLSVYHSSLPSDETSVHRFLDRLKDHNITAVLFTSALSANNLFEMAKQMISQSELVELLRSSLVAAIGPVTRRSLQERGLDPIVPSRYLISEAITQLVQAREGALQVSSQDAT